MRRKKPSRHTGPSGYLLDKFSQTDLRQWQKLSELIEQYHVRLYYHLEGLRDIHSEALRDSLAISATKQRTKGPWYRLVDFKYSAEFLSPRGSLVKGGRLNIGGDLSPARIPTFPALYIADNFSTAYAEYFGAPKNAATGGFNGHELALRIPQSFSAVKLRLSLENIFDLTKLSNLTAFSRVVSKFSVPKELQNIAQQLRLPRPLLATTPKQLRDTFLTSNWRHYPVQFEIPSNSQVFGRLLNTFGFGGVIYPSTKGTGKCIAIFTQNLIGSDAYLELVDEAPPNVKHARLDANTCAELSKI